MKHLKFTLIFLVFCSIPHAGNTQEMWQLMTAMEFHSLPPGPEKIKKIRELEQHGWYYQNTYLDLKGNPVETPKIDLSPYVDESGETVFWVTDIAPGFPGGTASFEDYLQNALGDLLAKPEESVQNSIRFKFSVEKDGRITEVAAADRIATWIPETVVQRCQQALEDMPAWSPGSFKDKPVKVKMYTSFSLRQ